MPSSSRSSFESRKSIDSIDSIRSTNSSAPSVASSQTSVGSDCCSSTSCTVCIGHAHPDYASFRPSLGLSTDFIALPSFVPLPVETFDDIPKPAPLTIRKRRATQSAENPFSSKPRSISCQFPPPPPRHTSSPPVEVFSPWDSRHLPSLFVASPTLPRRPTPALRHKRSPRVSSLRQLRVRESEACLQRVYEERTMAYLNGEMEGAGDRVRLGDLRRKLAPTPEVRLPLR